MAVEKPVSQEKVPPAKELKRYVLSRFDGETGVHVPLSKEEIIEFVLKFQGITKYFNDPEECRKIKMNEYEEGEPIYDHWRKAADRIVKEIWKHKDAWIFYEPVDPAKFAIPDYYNIIKEPMDLGTLKSNLRQGVYEDPESFEQDMLKIFSNCILYNGDTSNVSLMCKQVQSEYERLARKFQLKFYFK